MEIRIRKAGVEEIDGPAVDGRNTYVVAENGREFRIISVAHPHRTLSIVGEQGTLYIDSDDNKVHRQTVELGGGCGLIITDEPVEGLSPLAIRCVSLLREQFEYENFLITDEVAEADGQGPLVHVNGRTYSLSSFLALGK